jgi:hypothetical protein
MLTGVEILLERMKTNPEEFIEGGYSKWSRVLDAGFAVMTEDEREALQAGMIEAKREHFNGEVMRVLAQGHDDQLGRADDYLVKGKIPMQGNRPSKVITSQSMMNQATKLLSDEFDKQYDAYKAKGKPHAKT